MWHATTLSANVIVVARDLFSVGRILLCFTDQKWSQYTRIFDMFIYKCSFILVVS